MAAVSDRSDATASGEASGGDVAEDGLATGFWQWVLRIVLPPTAGLAGLLVYWVCFGEIYGPGIWVDIWRCLSALPLVIALVSIILWAWHSWLPAKPPGQSPEA